MDKRRAGSKGRETARSLRGVVGAVRLPPRYPPGHYYSALTNTADAARAMEWGRAEGLAPGIQMDISAMESFSEALAPAWSHLRLDRRYHRDEMFELADARVYRSMIERARPQRIVEVGSGFSTAIALDTAEEVDLQCDITCIEPNPERLLRLVDASDRVSLIKSFVQDVDLDIFATLGPNDILFIDSSHVAKAGSDVVFNFFEVLPRLAPGVIVHIHDIFWPFEYQPLWLSERRDWNEVYFLRAFLTGNPAWRVLHFNDLIWCTRPDLVAKFAPDCVGLRPGSFWMKRNSPTGG